MILSSEIPDKSRFLLHGGQMGTLIRNFNWDSTLGQIDKWPTELQSTLAFMFGNPLPMCIAWGNEQTQLYNESFINILGESRHPAALGSPTKETLAEVWPIIKECHNKALHGEPGSIMDLNLQKTANGATEECLFDLAMSPLRLADDSIGGVLLIAHDNTQRYRKEIKLREREHRFGALADNIPNLAWMADADGWIYWYNQKWYTYTGTTPEQMEGWGWQSVHDEAKLPEVMTNWKDAIARGVPFEMVFPLRRADGAFRHFLTRVLPGYDKHGKVNQWFGTNTDIEDQIEADNLLKESESRFRTMAEGTDILIAVGDESSNATYFNKAWENLTGRPQSDLIKFGWVDLIHPDDKQKQVDIYLDAFKNLSPFSGEFRVIDKHRVYRWILAKGAPRFKPNGSFAGYISSGIDITYRIEAEKSIKESEQRFRSLIEESPVATCMFMGRDMVTTVANRTMINYMGKGDKIIGLPLRESMPELVGQEFLNILDQVYTTGITYSAKASKADVVVNGRLQTFYFDFTYTALRNLDGEIYGVMDTAVDVTEKVHTAKKVEETANNLRNTILQAPVAMCILRGPQFVVELANELMFELWGRSGIDVLGKPIFEGLPEARDQGFEELLTNVYNTGNSYSAQGIPVTLMRNGKIQNVYVDMLYQAYREADRSVSGVLAVATDVTSQVIARNSIESAYQRFLTLSEAMPQIVWTATPDGNLDYFSQQWWSYSGLTFEESVGTGWASTIHPDDLPDLAAIWKSSLETGEPYGLEARVRKSDSTYRWFLIRALAVKNNGVITQWVGTCTDIQDQKHSEQQLHMLSSELATVNEELASVNEELSTSNDELEESNRQLKLINADLDNFIYTASHDLKAPIANIEGLMINLKEYLPQHTEQNQINLITSLIEASIERFKKTINQLTDISKLQTELNHHVSTVALGDVIEEVLLDLQFLISQSKADIKLELEPDQKVMFSYKNLRSIIYNLLSNAIKYRSKDRAPKIQIQCANDKHFLILSVSDNGMGIDLSQESKLFAIFGRLHDHVEGSGVGLYIVKKMVENAGGRIEVESQIGVGSTFRIYFKH